MAVHRAAPGRALSPLPAASQLLLLLLSRGNKTAHAARDLADGQLFQRQAPDGNARDGIFDAQTRPGQELAEGESYDEPAVDGKGTAVGGDIFDCAVEEGALPQSSLQFRDALSNQVGRQSDDLINNKVEDDS